MKITNVMLPAPLQIPSVWKTLLAIEDFDDLPVYPGKAHLSQLSPQQPYRDEMGGVKADWPHPLRDDCRELELASDDFRVRLTLVSGNNNYFTQVVVVTPDGCDYSPDEPSFDLSDEDNVHCGDLTVAWKQVFI